MTKDSTKEATVAGRADGFFGRPVGDLVLRGRKEPMRVYEEHFGWDVFLAEGGVYVELKPTSLSRATPSAVSERCSELIGRPISPRWRVAFRADSASRA